MFQPNTNFSLLVQVSNLVVEPITETVAGHATFDPSSPATSLPASSVHSRLLKTLPLAILIFYNVSGGPFGVEECVRASGPFYTLIGFCLAPFVWSLPEQKVTAELSVAFPHASGGAVWCGTYSISTFNLQYTL